LEPNKSLIVNSHNEWDPLEEVIVGDCFAYNIPDAELSFETFFHDNIYSYSPFNFRDSNNRPVIKQKFLEETKEDLDGLTEILQAMDIVVRRPKQLNSFDHFKTPYWESTCSAPYSVRDQAMVVADEIIETSPLLRCRYFENDLLKEAFYHYFNNGARWTSAPRPMMLDNSFDLSYIEKQNIDVRKIYPKKSTEYDIGFEIMFDAAQCLRFGEDIVMNVANKNHELGFTWLQRHLGSRYRFHKVSVADDHIDSIIAPLRAGTILLRHPSFIEKLPDFLRKWEIIMAPEIEDDIFPDYGSKDIMLASKYIDTNVLSIDGDKILVNKPYVALIKLLEKKGFTPVPVELRHRRIFGGGFHCVTLDVRRKGGLERYS